jgi:hypothetical protein
MDAANNAAEGSVPVEGHGPRGTITAQGFRVLDNGNITIFTGKSNMVLKSTAQQTTAPAPAAVPAPIAQAAAQIEAKMEAKPIAPAAHPAAAAKATPPPHHEAKAPAHPAPAPKKPG